MSNIQGLISLETVEMLKPNLATLKQNNAHHFDRTRFRYIESMVQKACENRASVKKIAEGKALAALRSYWLCFTRAQSEAALMVERVTAEFPDSAEQIQALFLRCEFRQVKQLHESLVSTTNTSLLSSLNSRLLHGTAFEDENHQDVPIEDILRQQEKIAVASLSEAANGQGTEFANEPGELKSTRSFRKSREKHGADKLVTQAIEEAPENSGPLNPQRLTIRSLSLMRELSPQYLNRFVAYIDTLLWLEQIDDRGS